MCLVCAHAATTVIYPLSLHDALPISVILFGRHYWAGLIRWLQSRVLSEAKISPGDLDLMLLTDDPREAAHAVRSEEHTSELQSRQYLVCRLLLEKKKLLIHKSTS